MTLPIRLLQIFHIIRITPIMFYKDIIIYSSLIIKNKKKFFFYKNINCRATKGGTYITFVVGTVYIYIYNHKRYLYTKGRIYL